MSCASKSPCPGGSMNISGPFSDTHLYGQISVFFLKNVHIGMRTAAARLFGDPGTLRSRPNVFGELMRVVVSPSRVVEDAVNWILNGGADPDMTLHMRMRMNK
ncbi:hypothetical protein ACLOJK_018755 [Asimina triloba]